MMELLITVFSLEGLIKISIGSLIGLCLGLTGVGGGVLIIPILQSIFGMHTVMAVGTASVISSLVKANAGLSHVIMGNVDWKSLKWMLLGAVPATYITTESIVYLSQDPLIAGKINTILEMVIILVMLAALLTIYMKYRMLETRSTAIVMSSKVAVSAGATCGAIMGSTGVGGGVMLLPAFNSLLGVDIKKSVGSSLVMALILSCLTAINYSKGGQSDISTAILISIGSLIGVPISMKLVKYLSDQKIYLFTMSIIVISMFLMFY